MSAPATTHAEPDPVSPRRTGTRSAVRTLLLERGPLTAGQIAHELGMTAAGVRRHLEQLESAGEVEGRSSARAGSRGRPARAFALTTSGRADGTHAYDGLAGDALAELRRLGGPSAVTEFARRRVRATLGHIPPARGPEDVDRATREIAEALSAAGYAASVEDAGPGVQICQHHCPVWHVASRFPELCEAEQEVVSEIVGTHVQRLATIADGHCACTTNIPTGTMAADMLAATIPDPTGVDASEETAERKQR